MRSTNDCILVRLSVFQLTGLDLNLSFLKWTKDGLCKLGIERFTSTINALKGSLPLKSGV